jgi:hypothetical protein
MYVSCDSLRTNIDDRRHRSRRVITFVKHGLEKETGCRRGERGRLGGFMLIAEQSTGIGWVEFLAANGGKDSDHSAHHLPEKM